jgi:MYXO-CTERM domain-containing protein
VATTQVPAASVGAPYQTVLSATGGGGVYAWSLGTGTLPPGLALAGDGTVSGTPSAAGTSAVTVKVTDQKSNSATAPLSFTVSSQALPLAVLTNSLPGGSFGVNYTVPLVAIGGAPPYQWSIVAGGGTPPPGIGIATDGTLAGAPEADGAFVFQVQVTDSANATAQSPPLDLQVLSPGSVGVAEGQLPPATEGVSYDGELLAAGGTPPYAWVLQDDDQLPSGPGDQSQDLGTAMPAGLSLDPSGNLSGEATVTGIFALTVQVTDSSTPPVTGSDTVLLNVLPGTALSILNATVPDATVGKPYIDTLETNATNATVTFTVVDGLGNDSPAARESLPPGIVLDPTGVLEGTPVASAAGSTSQTYDFLVKASDGTGRITVAAIALTVDPVPSGGGGCASAPGGDGFALMVVALAALALRRRRSA